jgi:acyl-coenzyme A synthetase/AMP-(fatty) acid ligase
VITMPRFDLENFLQLVQDYRVTRVLVVPPIVLALARHPAVPRYDLSSLRLITSAAAPLGAGLASECAPSPWTAAQPPERRRRHR